VVRKHQRKNGRLPAVMGIYTFVSWIVVGEMFEGLEDVKDKLVIAITKLILNFFIHDLNFNIVFLHILNDD
jgi:hypothetical protein